MVAAQHLYFLLSSFCLFSSWRNNVPVRLCIFCCVKRCPNASFHYYFFPMPYICQSRHVSRLSHNRQTSVCYFRFFQWVVSFNNQNFDINRTSWVYSDIHILKACWFLANHFAWTKEFPQNCLYMWQFICPKRILYQLLIVKSMFCSFFLRSNPG